MKSVVSREAGKLLCRYNTAQRASISLCRRTTGYLTPGPHSRKNFHSTPSLKVVKPYLLADIGEGITECQVIQWFVKPGARVEQFDPICEVQSDKASVEITSRFDGVIKKLYYEPDDMAKVGKPLVDIDIQGEISEDDAALLNGKTEDVAEPPTSPDAEQIVEVGSNDTKAVPIPSPSSLPSQTTIEHPSGQPEVRKQPGKFATLAVPAVRHLVKELKLNIEDIEGTGKDGRVTKEDVYNFAQKLKEKAAATTPATAPAPAPAPIPVGEDYVKPLTPVQNGMFKQMTRSLSIPHFLYSDSVDITALNALRKKFNYGKEKGQRLTPLPFIIKAVSLSLQQFPMLNAHLDTTTNPDKPQMVIKAQHNIGIAVDSPSGLLVPVIKNVHSHSIESLAAEIARLSRLGREGKLTNADLSGATFTVSNIGSIGGAAVSPVIVSPQVGILGVGKARVVPAFGEHGELVKKEECVFSWSADHRVIDGAMAARCAESVRGFLENIENMLVRLR
ncbi:branched-chain alpha-keto acid dehydrogenase E2 component [Westerdykella ornata]|uniref:Dihydrolipoamide acetyltransferase component of pyruvate dehydrogenase complex n=1 Tax=Westerdykella ornata TaxID=318751 RepID=A0A6A6JK22_WESOR|nr:branched-chain alpha-keto acid dehydrogenase E2 component [Westerdykella ornata]KAF2276046.1 branched-chain alpha-keto acid dehydrogenase E2 component [Westerdykella ornata]